MVTYNNNCLKCIHFGGQKACLAFPDGIPDEIWTGKNKHTKPYKGDGGIRFERNEAGSRAPRGISDN